GGSGPRGWGGRLRGIGRRTRLDGGTGAGRGEKLLARGIYPELAPEPLGLRQVLGFGEPPGAERRRRAGHRAHARQLCGADLETPAADRAHEVVVRAVGNDGHEVEADRLLRPDVVEEHLVVTVRADARRDLAQVLLLARPEAENHHGASEAQGRIAAGRASQLAQDTGRHSRYAAPRGLASHTRGAGRAIDANTRPGQ